MGASAPLKYHHSYCRFAYSVKLKLGVYHVFVLRLPFWEVDLCGRHRQVGSLAGAAHLLNNNGGVLRQAQREQKSLVDQKGKSLLDFDFQYEYKL